MPPERFWFYKCKGECSLCPLLMSELQKEEGNEIKEHFAEGIRGNETKYVEAETLIFHCPKCNQKWAVAGEIPSHIRLAFKVNDREREIGIRLTCYAC